MRLILVSVVVVLLGIGGMYAQNSPAQEIPAVKQRMNQSFTVELFPNPTVNFLNISISDAEIKNVQFELYTIIGNKVDFDVEKQNNASYKINVESLNQGYYLLVVKDPMSRINKAYKFRKL